MNRYRNTPRRRIRLTESDLRDIVAEAVGRITGRRRPGRLYEDIEGDVLQFAMENYDKVWPFENGYAKVYKEGLGYNLIDEFGRLLWGDPDSERWFEYISPFEDNGRAYALRDGNKYAITSDGEVIYVPTR